MGKNKIPVKSALERWKTHNPFERADPKLIKAIEKERLQNKRQQHKDALL